MNGKIEFTQDGPIARVTLAHPGRLNAMSRSMWREIRSVFESIQKRSDLRCVLIRGLDGNFCPGGDISEYPDFRFNKASLREFHEGDVWGGLTAMLACDVPIVALIEGACMGAGLEIACCCDLRIASASAQFGAPIAKLGFPMAPREAALVALAAGELTTREMLLEAAFLSAEEMKSRGFLNRVVADDAVAASAEASVQRIANLPPMTARLNKQTLRHIESGALAGFAKLAVENIANPAARARITQTDPVLSAYHYADSTEHREGITAFLAKRKPQF